MEALVACPDCGTPNRPDADLCVQCWRGMNEDLAQRIPVAAFAVNGSATATLTRVGAPPPPPMPPRTLREAPARPPVREVTPGPVPYFAPMPQPAPAGATVPPATTTTAAPRRWSGVEWKWPHLLLFGICAWGFPMLVSWLWAPKFHGRGVLDAVLAIQMGGYVLAALVAVVLVQRVQGGDWSTLGIRWSERAWDDVFRGMGWGLLLIGTFLGGYLAVTGGNLEVDGLVRTFLGGTSGPGLILAALVLVVGAPVIEELYFRGMLFEKLSRRGGYEALVVTSLLFVRIHGSLLIPSLLLLSFGLGWKRRTKTIWFTMGGHAAWNFVVICLAVFVMTGPAEAFSPDDAAYSLRHPATWERVDEAVVTTPTGSVDLVLQKPNGSMIAVARAPMAPGMHRGNFKSMFNQARSFLPVPPGFSASEIEESDLITGGFVSSYELSVTITDPMIGAGRMRLLAVVRDGAPDAVVMIVACPQAECASADEDFERMAKSFQFSV